MILVIFLSLLPQSRQSLLIGILLGGLYAMMALGLSLILGVLKIVNLAYGETLILGAYVSYYSTQLWGLSSLVSLILVVPILFVFGVFIHRAMLTKILAAGGEPLILLFGLALALQNLMMFLWTPDARSIPSPLTTTIHVEDAAISLMRVVTFIISVLTVMLIRFVMSQTRFGLMVRAAAQNKDAAELVGINTTRVYTLLFGIGCALTGFSAVFTGILFPFNPVSGLAIFLKSLAVVTLAGMGSIGGLVISGLVIGIVESLGGYLIGGGFKDLFTYGLLLIIIIVKPTGFFGRY